MDGFSAFVGPDGRVTALARGSGKDVLTREAELREGPATPYIRFGNAAALILSALLALAAFIAGRRALRRESQGV